MHYKKLSLILFFITNQSLCLFPKKHLHEIIIIVPGTWAIKESWYKIGGNFFETLQEAATKMGKKVIWFRWLTNHYESSRQKGAQELAHFLKALEPKTLIHVVSHSHGTNVVLGACQLLQKECPKRKISSIFSLGAPIYEEVYKPNMNIIKRLYNLYSLNDGIQTILAYKRIFKSQPGIFNIRTFIENKEPTHSQMHDPAIGKWLFYLLNQTVPPSSTINFFKDNLPIIKDNPEEKKLLENDKPLNLQAFWDLRKKKN